MESILYFTKKLHAYSGNILYANLFGMLFISFLDGMGMLLLIPLLSLSGIAGIGGGSASSLLSLLDPVKELPQPLGLLLILGAYVLLMAGQTLLQRNLSLREIRIHTGFINHIRLETYKALLQANWQFFIKKRKSDLILALTDELGRVTNGTYLFLQFMASCAFTLLQAGIAFWLSAKLTVFVLVCGAVMAFFSRAFIRKSKRLGSQTSDLARSYVGNMTDQLNGIKEIKSSMLERSRIRWLENWNERISDERYGHARLRANSQLYYKLSSTLLIAVFLYLSVRLFQSQGPQLLLIIFIFARLWPRFTGLQSQLEQVAASIPAFQALMELQRECRAAKESGNEGEDGGRSEALRIEEGIECRGVSFRYNREEPVYALQQIDVRIRARQMTAVIGRSGAGKSTLIDLLMGLLQPEAGQVLIDGVPLTGSNLLPYRKAIGYVAQDPLLFNGTIRENLLLMEPDAKEEQLWEALRFAAAADFVARLPQGLDTLVGDRGVRLSGGERQRLVLARAMLRRPAILVLDEATSALDTENETLIQEALERLKGSITLIVIAHRLSTIRNADQVIVLDQGKLARQDGVPGHIPGTPAVGT